MDWNSDLSLEEYGMSTSRELPSSDYYKRPEFDDSALVI
jgi:hypothetical protein